MSIDKIFRTAILIFCVSLIIRLVVALLFSKLSLTTGDVGNFIYTAQLTEKGFNVYEYQKEYPYPPTYAWILGYSIYIGEFFNISDDISVKIPSIIADSVISSFIYLLSCRLIHGKSLVIGLIYVFNPITILVTCYRGQFESLSNLPFVIALWYFLKTEGGKGEMEDAPPSIPPLTSNILRRYTLWLSALFLGISGAIKIVPAFISLAWMHNIRGFWRILIFYFIVALPILAVLAIGFQSAPSPFRANVLEYGQVTTGGWGYNFISTLVEQTTKFLNINILLSTTHYIRSYNRYILLSGVLLTTYMVRNKPFLERSLLIQLSIQLFAGGWMINYTAWLVPLVIISNERGMFPWMISNIIWMILAEIGHVMQPSLIKDNFYRASTILGFLSWLILLIWYMSHVVKQRAGIFDWFTRPVIISEP
jgi:hypothetical protein